MNNRYTVQPVSRHAKGKHRWMVVDDRRHICIRFTVTEAEAIQFASTMNTTPAIPVYAAEGWEEF
jgi:hypothetical protein